MENQRIGFLSPLARAATMRASVGVISGRRATCAVTLVGEVVELADDLIAALPGVQVERLQRRAIVLLEAVPGRHLAPDAEDVRPQREILWREVAKTRQTLGNHGLKYTPGVRRILYPIHICRYGLVTHGADFCRDISVGARPGGEAVT